MILRLPADDPREPIREKSDKFAPQNDTSRRPARSSPTCQPRPSQTQLRCGRKEVRFRINLPTPLALARALAEANK